MICGLNGKISKLEPMRAEVDVNDVVYEVFISIQTSTKLQLNQNVNILISEIIREDAFVLYGFLDSMEKATFERLLKINGVGPKVALAILSTFSPKTFSEIVRNKDLKMLQKVPGIGAKSAGKILLDLAGFFSEILESSASDSTFSANQEAILALESLGYKTSDIKKIMPSIKSTNTQEIIKEALKLL